MEFSCPSKVFKQAFDVAARFVPTRPSVPILSSVLIEVGPGNVWFSAQDLDIGVRHQITGVDVSALGVCLLPKEQLAKVLATADGETLRFRLDADRKLTVRAGAARWTVVTASHDTYPLVAEFAAESHCTLETAEFRRMVERTIYAIDAKSVKYALGGLSLESTPEQLSAVATSGRTLARQTIGASYTGEFTPSDSQVVVPARTLKELLSILPDDLPTLDLGVVNRSSAHFRFGETTLTARLMEGRFPPYKDVFPEVFTQTVTVDPGPFRKAVEQAAAMRSESSRLTSFEFSEGRVRITSETPDAGDSEVDHAVEWTGETRTVHLDPTFLLDMLKSFGSAPAKLCLAGKLDHVVLKTEDGFIGAIAQMSKGGPGK